MKYPPLQVVDENDKPIDDASLETVYGQGLIYRVVFVVVEDENGSILLQKRSSEVGTYPDCWDISVGGHVDAGESYEQAAHREAAEELGLHDLELTEDRYDYNRFTIKSTSVFHQRFFKTFRTVIPRGTEIKFNKEEISQVKWFTKEEAMNLIKTESEVGAGLVEALGDYENHEY